LQIAIPQVPQTLRHAGSLKLRHSTIEAMLNGHQPARFCAQTLEKFAFSG
jgi:hypothetical protein